MHVISIVSFFLTIIGLFLTFLSYIKISNVRKAQQEYKNNINLDNILTTLHDVYYLLEEIQPELSMNQNINGHIVQKINGVEKRIYKTIGYAESANNIMLSNKSKELISPVYYDSGYFGTKFFNQTILNAKFEIIICCWWNACVFQRVIIDDLVKLHNKNKCKIIVMGFSTEMEERVLTELRKCIHQAPVNHKLREMQQEGKQLYLKEKSEYNMENFDYYESLEYLPFHCIWVDHKFYWGLVNYHKIDDPAGPFGAYLEFNRESNFSIRILEKFNALKEKAKKIS